MTVDGGIEGTEALAELRARLLADERVLWHGGPNRRDYLMRGRFTWTAVALTSLGSASASTAASGRGTISLGPRTPGAAIAAAGWPFTAGAGPAFHAIDDADRVPRLIVEARETALGSSGRGFERGK